MTDSKKSKIKENINTFILVATFLAIVFGGYKGAVMWGEYTATQKAIQDQRMFKDAEQRIKTKNHINSPWTEYQSRMKTDTLVRQQQVVLVAFDSFNKRNAADEEDKASRIKSRAVRDSLRILDAKDIKQIKEDNNRIENAIQLILTNQKRLLDSVN